MANKPQEFIIAGSYISVTLKDGTVQSFRVACSKVEGAVITGDFVHAIEYKAYEQLQSDLRTSDLNRQSLWADSLKLVDENALLKSKLKLAVKAIHDLFNKAKDGSHYESIAREALKEIGEV